MNDYRTGIPSILLFHLVDFQSTQNLEFIFKVSLPCLMSLLIIRWRVNLN